MPNTNASNNSEYVYDWNTVSTLPISPGTRVLLNDETLRDGLQNPSVYDPTIEEKIEILHLMESLGIESLNIGLPGAGPRAVEHTEALAREIATNRMKIRPNCAARTLAPKLTYFEMKSGALPFCRGRLLRTNSTA